MKNERVVEIKLGRTFWIAISAAMYVTGWAFLFWVAGILYTFGAVALILLVLFNEEKLREFHSKSKPIGISYIVGILVCASLFWQFLDKGYIVFAGAVFLTFIIGFTFRLTKRV